MKIGCFCGHKIAIQTDAIPYRAYLVPDQDHFDMYVEADGLALPDGTEVIKLDAFEKASARHLYQCEACGRLYIEDAMLKKLYCFVPADDSVPKHVLRGRGEG